MAETAAETHQHEGSDDTGQSAAPVSSEQPDGVLDLGPDQIEGLPSSAPIEDIVLVVESELGTARQVVPTALTCDGPADAETYLWDGFSLTHAPGDVRWQIDDGPLRQVSLPHGVGLGTAEADLRADNHVVEESMTGGGWPVLTLQNGLSVTLDPSTRRISSVASEYVPVC
ncbi:hypothetical protein [Ornithinimicrobium sp. Y1694]|uniref:hypothetical protein n=1 Tax=Ornithinimicrobium sp. Y1694 TaxID=3418590 RepID=UPI003CF91B6E